MSSTKKQWVAIILGLFWLPCGFLFMANTHDFDWGFFPTLVWVPSFFVISLVSVIVVGVHIARYRLSRRRLLFGWIFHSLAYFAVLAIFVYHVVTQ